MITTSHRVSPTLGVVRTRPFDPIISFASPQRGVALIMALMMLVILTILGMAAMSTTTLEEKMAGNIQESTRAFQAAESGISSLLIDPNVLNPNATVTKTYEYDSKKSGLASVQSRLIEYTPPRARSSNPDEIFSASNFQSAHFELTSTGTTLTNARSVHHQGIEQVVASQ